MIITRKSLYEIWDIVWKALVFFYFVWCFLMGSKVRNTPVRSNQGREATRSVWYSQWWELEREWGWGSWGWTDELNNCICLLFVTLGKEIKKSKLIRSQSFNNQAFHAKYGNLDKCTTRYDLSALHILT